ncbi:MAG: NAD(P)/FAD-dependent oxidoreductase [Phyllobacteriaceae bacterium]|nr:NAD(P)/FAD-dependent oxidoreductase [Phyllobacteriaceae bacterium]
MPSFDAVVIGAGVNGLACAGRLSKAGLKVQLVDQAAQVGGAMATREFAPGYRVSAVAHLVNALDARVESGLDLARHGLKWSARDLATTALGENGDHLVLCGAFGERLDGSISAADRAAWTELRVRLLRFAAVLAPFKAMSPPRLAANAGNDLIALAKIALKLRLLGRDDMREFLRLLLINVADVVEDEFADDRLKGLIAFDATLGAHLGPRSPNTLILLLNRLASQAAGTVAGLALPKGGMGAVAAAMANAVAELGVDVRANAPVRRVLVEGDRAVGVELQCGEIIRARHVVSAANPKTTFLDLVGRPQLDTGFVRRTRSIRMRGGAAKFHLALSGAPDFRGADLTSRLVIAPSVNAVENAFNAVKYNRFSEKPVMEIIVPSAFEDGLAPAGHHVLSAIVQFAPREVEGGWNDRRGAFGERIMATLEAHAPGISGLIVAAQMLSPEDIERDYSMIGGDWHHGELAVEQMLFLRPAVGAAGYATPVPGLWLAGAGSHPGGGVSGAAGWNAAERLIGSEGAQ